MIYLKKRGQVDPSFSSVFFVFQCNSHSHCQRQSPYLRLLILALSSSRSILEETSRNGLSSWLSLSPVRFACNLNHHRPNFLLPFWALTLALQTSCLFSFSHTFLSLPKRPPPCSGSWLWSTYILCAWCDTWYLETSYITFCCQLSMETPTLPYDLNLNILVPFMFKFFYFCPTDSSPFAQPSTLEQNFSVTQKSKQYNFTSKHWLQSNF